MADTDADLEESVIDVTRAVKGVEWVMCEVPDVDAKSEDCHFITMAEATSASGISVDLPVALATITAPWEVRCGDIDDINGCRMQRATVVSSCR